MCIVAPESRMKGPGSTDRLVRELTFGDEASRAFEKVSEVISLLLSRQSTDAECSSMNNARYSSPSLYQFVGKESVESVARQASGVGMDSVLAASRIASPVSESIM